MSHVNHYLTAKYSGNRWPSLQLTTVNTPLCGSGWSVIPTDVLYVFLSILEYLCLFSISKLLYINSITSFLIYSPVLLSGSG